MKRLIAFFITLIAMPLAALANPYDNKAQVELLHGWSNADGTRTAALHIKLAEGWKTYWRAPGDAGIPPQFDWTSARNLAGVTLQWPRPVVFHQNGLRSIGYESELILPMVLEPKRAGKPIHVDAVVDIGICRDICVPLRIELDETLRPETSAPDAAIKAALAKAPISAQAAGLTALTCSARKGEDGLIVTLSMELSRLGGREEAAIETGDPLIWAKEPNVTRQGNRLSVSTEFVHALGGAFALNRSALRLTVIGSKRAVDIQGCG